MFLIPASDKWCGGRKGALEQSVGNLQAWRWGYIRIAGLGKLNFIDGIMDQHVYIDIFGKNLHPSADQTAL